MPAPPTSPTCLCGYNLAGLPGPPWTCPECGAITTTWPPRRQPLLRSPREVLHWRLAIAAIIACPLLLPWLRHVNGVVAFAGPVLIGGLHAGSMTIAAYLSRHIAHDEFPGSGSRQVPWFLSVWFSAATCSYTLAYLADLAHEALGLP